MAGFEAGKYIRSIRNAAKQQYARDYMLYILRGKSGKSPDYTVSYMAAQAVRTNLDRIFKATFPSEEDHLDSQLDAMSL